MPTVYPQYQFRSPPGSADILLVRHGESAPLDPEHPFDLVDGHGDPPLRDVGVEQANCVALRLRNEPIETIYVSNLQRTQQTAAPLCREMNMEPVVIPDLREIFLGEFEGGVYRQKVAQQHPAYRQAFKDQEWSRIPGAESNAQFESRLMGALQRIKTANVDRQAVAFVHGAVIAQIIAAATGAQPMAFLGANNGSITHIVMTESRILVRRFNDTSHLTERYRS